MIHLILTLRDPAVERPDINRAYGVDVFYKNGEIAKRVPLLHSLSWDWSVVLGWIYPEDRETQITNPRDPNDVFEARCTICDCNILECPHNLGQVYGTDENPCTLGIVQREKEGGAVVVPEVGV